jgi:hypothetical protein
VIGSQIVLVNNNGKKENIHTYPHPLALSACKQDNRDGSIFDKNNIRLRIILGGGKCRRT